MTNVRVFKATISDCPLEGENTEILESLIIQETDIKEANKRLLKYVKRQYANQTDIERVKLDVGLSFMEKPSKRVPLQITEKGVKYGWLGIV